MVFNQTWVMEPGASGAIVTPLISTSDLREELDVNTYFCKTYTIPIKHLFLHQITGRSSMSIY